MDAKDLVYWLMIMLTQNKLNYDVFNVGSENKIEIEEISKLFKDILELRQSVSMVNLRRVIFIFQISKKQKVFIGLIMKRI